MTQALSQFGAQFKAVWSRIPPKRRSLVGVGIGAFLCIILFLFLQGWGAHPSASITRVESNQPLPSQPSEIAPAISVEQQLRLQQAISDEFSRQVRALLEGPFGPGAVEAMVRVEINFEKYEEIVKAFDAPNGDFGIVRSEHRVDERLDGSPETSKSLSALKEILPVPSGIDGDDLGFTRSELSVNYEVNQTESRREIPPGAIRRLSVAVLIDGGLTDDQEEAVAETLTTALGLDPSRGDQVHVDSMLFAGRASSAGGGSEVLPWRLPFWGSWSPVFLASLTLLVLLLILRARRAASEEIDLRIHEEEEFVSERKLTPEDRKRQHMHEQVISVAKEKPDNIARLLRSWLAEE